MPNWCECDLKIEGPTNRVREFLEFAKGGEDQDVLDFNKFIPYPSYFEDLDDAAEEWRKEKPWAERTEEERLNAPKDGYNSGGYDWCVLNWGTKWNACRVRVDFEEEYQDELAVMLTFETAWSPPKPVIQRAAEMFPDLEFDMRFFECGCMFNGTFRCHGGEVTEDETADYYGNRGG